MHQRRPFHTDCSYSRSSDLPRFPAVFFVSLRLLSPGFAAATRPSTLAWPVAGSEAAATLG